jgi:pimeloyl-ACP methyl ester carboxylesterase
VQGAESYRKDLKNIDIQFFDTGHFALEENAEEIAQAILRSFTQ